MMMMSVDDLESEGLLFAGAGGGGAATGGRMETMLGRG